MSGEPTVIYSAANVQQAYLLKGLLEERGIAAWVVNDGMRRRRRAAAGLDGGGPRGRERAGRRGGAAIRDRF